MVLKSAGSGLGITKPFEMFWATGALSSFLDNTPTYLVFLTTAGAMHFTTGVATTLGVVPVKMLMAISCGAVFMGANTYIGNAPNFMVKRYQHAIVLWLHVVVIALSDTCFHHRYDHILFIGGMNYGIL